jgi:hypothetical protein
VVNVRRDRSQSVRIEGLADFRRELKALSEALPGELRDLNKEIADKVAGTARSSFQGRSGSAPKVAGTVKSYGQATGAAVAIGGGSTIGGQVAMGNEFGSVAHKQFPAWRGNDAGAGYSLYPAIRRGTSDIEDTYGDRLERLARRAFPD